MHDTNAFIIGPRAGQWCADTIDTNGRRPLLGDGSGAIKDEYAPAG
jgi:hypothetical protein